MKFVPNYLGVVMLAVAAQANPIQYTITDLGTLGGPRAAANAINANGETAGTRMTVTGDSRAFSSGTDLTPAGASYGMAAGINSAGQIAGTTYMNGTPFATVWNGTTARYLGAESHGMALNDAGQVTGMAVNGAGFGHAFLNTAGVMTDLGAPGGGTWSSGYAINAAGQIAGYGDTASGAFRGFIWSGGDFVQLGTLGGANSYAFGLNAYGTATGSAQVRNGYLHAFVSSAGAMVDLGTLGGQFSSGYGINDRGAVVGNSTTVTGADHAFLYQGGVMSDLNSLLISASGWELTAAYAINSRGQIAGSGLLGGVEHAFRLDPMEQISAEALSLRSVASVPEPVTLGLLGSGLALLGLLHRSHHTRVE